MIERLKIQLIRQFPFPVFPHVPKYRLFDTKITFKLENAEYAEYTEIESTYDFRITGLSNGIFHQIAKEKSGIILPFSNIFSPVF